MTTGSNYSSLPQGLSLASGLEALLVEACNQTFVAEHLTRLSIEILALNSLSVLASLATICNERCYFAQRNQQLSIAGIGRSHCLKAANDGELECLLNEAQEIVAGSDSLWVGGSSFNGQCGEGQWQDFPAALYVLPLIELREQQGVYTLAVNLYAHTHRAWLAQHEKLQYLAKVLLAAAPSQDAGCGVLARRDSSGFAAWKSSIDSALESIARGKFRKVVLAREVALELYSAACAFTALARINRHRNRAYLFAIENANSVFFGCSPERLFRKQGQRLSTEALAGTLRRGSSDTEDTCLQTRFIYDEKLALEHRLVAEAIERCMRPMAMHISRHQPMGVVKLSHIQHSYQPISAVLMPDVRSSDVFQNLHPTPAICGYPRNEAHGFIRQHEHFQRGWYSGAVGVIGADFSEFSVAIRSALSQSNALWLYSGVGIVEGSDPAEEWQELESKLTSLLQALGASDAVVH